MSIEYKDFTEETFPDVKELLVSRFGEGVLPAMEKLLRNPLRRIVSSAGCIGYKNGKAVCFKASILRRMYFGREEVLGLVGGYFCKAEKGCPLPVILEVQERAEWDRFPCRLRFGNTCIYATMRMNAQLGAHQGPDSWSKMFFTVIHPLSFLRLLFCRKVLKRPQVVESEPVHAPLAESRPYVSANGVSVCRTARFDSKFHDFWEHCLAENRGIVSSRDMDTLSWMFGTELEAGKYVLLTACAGTELQGYLIVRPMPGSCRRWQIMDLIARHNDEGVLHLLLKGAKLFLRRDTSAITLESTGFPDFMQPLLRRHLPHMRDTGHNRFEWITKDPEIIHAVEEKGNQPESWFFGPYDGDFSM